ncbi:hypothetical protein BKA81DRAFT_360185 [Phyllosticta paracitricarpa]
MPWFLAGPCTYVRGAPSRAEQSRWRVRSEAAEWGWDGTASMGRDGEADGDGSEWIEALD